MKATFGRFLLPGVLGVLAVPFVLFLVFDRDVLERLKNEGLLVEAHVYDKHIKLLPRGGRDYCLDVRFVLDGRDHELCSDTSRGHYLATTPGDRVAITVLPDDPTVHRIGVVDDAAIERAMFDLVLAAALVAAILAPFAVYVEVVLRRRRRLLRDRVAAVATITRAGGSGRLVSHFPVDYVFALPGGRQVAGRARLRKTLAAAVAEGVTITVVHDPQDPGRNTLLPALLESFRID